jgi:ketosteroid isomerase-like protein
MTVSRPRALFLALPALVNLACRAPAPGAGDDARRQAVAIVRSYQSATNAEDAEQLASLYADDALLLPPDGGVVSGRDDIAGFWRDGLERGLSMDTLRLVTGTDLGYVVGRYYLAGTESAPPDSGKFVLALSRVEGGWKVAADIWNATPSETDDDGADPRTRILTAIPASYISRLTPSPSSSLRGPRRAAPLTPSR